MYLSIGRASTPEVLAIEGLKYARGQLQRLVELLLQEAALGARQFAGERLSVHARRFHRTAGVAQEFRARAVEQVITRERRFIGERFERRDPASGPNRAGRNRAVERDDGRPA